MQLSLFLFPLQHMKTPALQNKQLGVLRMAFRARKVFGTFEKRAPGCLDFTLIQFFSYASRSELETWSVEKHLILTARHKTENTDHCRLN